MLRRMTFACATARDLLRTWQVPAPAPLDFVVVGLNHQTAPVEVRERATVRPGEEAALLAQLQSETRLALASGLTLESADTLSLPVHSWRKADAALQARIAAALAAPCIFTWGP